MEKFPETKMDGSQLQHATLTFERVVPAPLKDVFHALSDVNARAAWGAPSDTAVVLYDASDFRVGGVDRYRCGARANPNIRGTTWYTDIIADKRIVSAVAVALKQGTSVRRSHAEEGSISRLSASGHVWLIMAAPALTPSRHAQGECTGGPTTI
jgi:uncharacterized protein YndB with AHSA1/START domain